MKKTLEEYLLKSQLWVSIMALCLSLFFQLVFKDTDYYRATIVFLSTFIGYNYIQYHEVWIRKRKRKGNFASSVLAFILLVLFLLKEPDQELLLNLSVLAVFVLLYNSYFIPLKIRKIPILKIVVIAFVWTSVLLFIGNSAPISVITFLSVFLFTIGLAIPFDIVDMDQDSVKTLPKILGINYSICLSLVCFMISILCFYVSFPEEYLYLEVWSITSFIAMVLVVFIKKNLSYFYTRFWIELCSAFPLFIGYLLK